MTHNASLIVFDDLRIERGGKMILIGCYTGDIAIPKNPIPSINLACMFLLDINPHDLPQRVEVELKLPGKETIKEVCKFRDYSVLPQDRTEWVFRHFLRVQDKDVPAGPIVASIIVDGEMNRLTAPSLVWNATYDQTESVATRPEPTERQPPTDPQT